LAQSPGTGGRICKAEKSKTRDTSDTQFVAVDAAWIEPVSNGKFPARWETTGNSTKNGLIP
jgi:hypothetical protein